MARVEAEVGKAQGGFMKWIDDRFPFTKTMKQHVTEYYAAKNFNVWYVFGVLAMTMADLEALRRGDRRALARAITLVESQRAEHREAAESLLQGALQGK